MNLLAVDPGSHETALALFVDGKLKKRALIKGGKFDSWQDRMSTIADEIGSLDFGVLINVIAIEKVVAGKNLNVAITMGMTNGYLLRTLEALYVHAAWIEVPKADICRELGIKGNARRADRQLAARERFGLPSQDENDAAAVGIAALQMLEDVR